MHRRIVVLAALGGWAAYLLLPVYALVAMALRTNESILSERSVIPAQPTLANFVEVFTDPSWYEAFGHSATYVAINTVISIFVALPAAYAFSRYRFTGDSHLFFWLLTNRMAPPAVFLLPVFQLYSAVGLFDTPLAVALAHCLFTVPLAVWILEGFMSAVPREIDELARIDGHRFPYFFVRIFLPLVRAGIGVTVFFCFMFSWVELLLARTLTAANAKPIVVAMTRTVSASGLDWGVLAAVGVVTVLPGLLVVWFVRGYLVKGFALGRV
jgi:glycerol transport system permease protein